MKSKFNLIEAAMKYKQITIFFTVSLVLFGAYALFVMPRQEFPEFIIRQGIVAAVMPGASSEQIENQVTVPIENYLFSYKEVNKKKTYSQSRDGIVYIFVELNEDVKEPSEFWSKLKHGLNDLKAKLPSDLYGVFVNDDFGNTSAMLISLESDTKSYKDLQNYMKVLESRLRRVESISKLNRVGMLNEVINVYLQPEKLTFFGVKPVMITMAFKGDASTAYGGEIKNNKMTLPVHIGNKYRTVEDIAEQIILYSPTGQVIRLKDVATIRREAQDPDSYITNNRTKCLMLSIEMLEGKNIVAFGDNVAAIMEQFSKELPNDVKIRKVANQPEVVKESIEHFLKEFGIAILSVIIVTMLLLPFRVSAVAGSTIPISILISLGILFLFNVQLDTVTLAALIIVLGMVVDNTIVVVDNYVEKLDNKIAPWTASIEAAKELALPVFTATLAILATFVPLAMFMRGTGGDFIKNFPITVAVTLLSSLAIAIFLAPMLSYIFIKKGIHNHDESNDVKKRKSMLDYMQAAYDTCLELAFKFPKSSLMVSFATIIVGVIFFTKVPTEFFPKMERNQFAVEIYLPNGSSLALTDSVVKSLETKLLKDHRTESVTSFIGGSSPRFHTVYAPNMPAKNYAQMIVNTKDIPSALAMLDEYSQKITNFYPQAHIRFKQLDMQSTKAPIEVRVVGDSIQNIKQTAQKVAQIFRNDKRVSWIRDDYEEATQSLRYDIDYAEASRLGFSKFDITTFLAVANKGLPFAKIWEDDYPIDIQLNIQKDKLGQEIDNKDLYVPSLFLPEYAPLRQLAKSKAEWTEGQIVRRNGVRTLSVLVDVNRNETASIILKDAEKQIEALKLPSNVSIDYGGEKFDEGEQYPSLIKALLTGVLSIFVILLFQFKKLKTALLIMTTMPLSIFGASLGLLIMNYPFGMTAFIGIISLCGVVVRNGIILVDYVNQLIAADSIDIREAAIAGGKRRMRPIFLTSAAAAVGVIPMIISRSPLWGPLATVICFGLLFSMVLTLIALPVMYWYFMKNEHKSVEKAITPEAI
jgi:multidrug efflux pump subunit AcrB